MASSLGAPLLFFLKVTKMLFGKDDSLGFQTTRFLTSLANCSPATWTATTSLVMGEYRSNLTIDENILTGILNKFIDSHSEFGCSSRLYKRPLGDTESLSRIISDPFTGDIDFLSIHHEWNARLYSIQKLQL